MSFGANWQGAPKFATRNQLLSSINGVYIDISGITIDASGIFISSGELTVPFVSLSTLSFKGFDDLLDLDVSFDLGLGKALGGAVAGLGAAVGGAAIAVGTGAGLAISGAAQGLATLVAPRGQDFISQTKFETINFTTQLQVSTLGNAYPLYSTIFRTVSSINAEEVPGREIFTSSFFLPGQVCIRSASDPFNLITGDVNLNTSSIQSFGQWVPFDGLEPDNILAETLTLSNVSQDSLFRLFRNPGSNPSIPVVESIQTIATSNNFPFPFIPTPLSSFTSKVFSHTDEYVLNQTFISTPYYVFQSTILADIGLVFITSNVPTPSLYTYSNTMFIGDFAICEPDETGFRSTATMDFIAQGNNLQVQWGTLAQNRNSTIGIGTGKRVSWDNTLGTSNFTDIPAAQSTIVNQTTEQVFELLTTPYEIQINTGVPGLTSQIAFNVAGATFGSNTTLNNQAGYPYQFNGNVFINGTVEAQTIVALSSIFATSTFVDTNFSTQSFEADIATIAQAFISSLTANSIATTSFSTVSLATTTALTTSLSTTQLSASNGLMSNLTVNNLFATNLIYSNAEAPTIQTSTINFGWTGSFDVPIIPQFSLQQNLITEPGVVFNTFPAASNQVLNIMNFSNTVNFLTQQLSTPLAAYQQTFDGSGVQGWASTIFFGKTVTGFNEWRINLNSGGSATGELSLQSQGQSFIYAYLNGSTSSINTGPGDPTRTFELSGGLWYPAPTPPAPGVIQYMNNLKLSMDFDNTNLTTTDTLNINAEQINLNGIVTLTQPFVFSTLQGELIDATTLLANTLTMNQSFTGLYVNVPNLQPLQMGWSTVTLTDFTNQYTLTIPSRAPNYFNSLNVSQWNDSVYNAVYTSATELPHVLVGDLFLSVSPATYSGEFYINNDQVGVTINLPIYQNRGGFASTIGVVASNTIARIRTTNGSNWSIDSNVANPQGGAFQPYQYKSQQTTTFTEASAAQQTDQPLTLTSPQITMNTNKVLLRAPMIRTLTYGSSNWQTREAGIEYSSYFDASVVFTGSQSDAVNPILNPLGNLYYAFSAWSAQVWFGRIRTASLGIQGFDIIGSPLLYAGTSEFIWASTRYLNVVDTTGLSADIREMYLMIPANYMSITSFTNAW